MANLVTERETNGPYANLTDFVSRLNTQTLNKRQLENLIRAGGLDCLDKNRRKIYKSIENIMRHAAAVQNDRKSNQIGLFSEESETNMAIKIAEAPDWDIMERLHEEFDALGCYLSGHPLDAYGTRLKQLGVETAADAMKRSEIASVKLVGTVISKKERTSAKGNRYAFIGLSDLSGTFEVTAFSEVLTSARDFLDLGKSVFIKATAQPEEDNVRFLAEEFIPLEVAAARALEHLRICINSDHAVPVIRDILSTDKSGRCRIRIHTQPSDCNWSADLELNEGYALSPDVQLALRNIPEVMRIETFEVN